MSKTLDAVCADLSRRESVGTKKYGTTLDRKDLSPSQRLQHAYEEALDLAMYLKSLLLVMTENGEAHDPRAIAARERATCDKADA